MIIINRINISSECFLNIRMKEYNLIDNEHNTIISFVKKKFISNYTRIYKMIKAMDLQTAILYDNKIFLSQCK